MYLAKVDIFDESRNSKVRLVPYEEQNLDSFSCTFQEKLTSHPSVHACTPFVTKQLKKLARPRNGSPWPLVIPNIT